MTTCTPCSCQFNMQGQLADPSCPNQDCFKYCVSPDVNNNSTGYDVRTLTIPECNSIYAGNEDAKNRCLAYAIVPGSSNDTTAPPIEQQEQDLKNTNNKIWLIAAVIIIAIVVATLIYSL